MAKLPDVLAPLAALNSARKNAAEYYAPLLASADPILQLGAWCALLDRGEVSYAQYPAVLAMADNPAIRDRAYRSFLKFFDYGPAEQVAATKTNRLDEAERRAMAAELNGDPEQRAASLRELYLVTGRTDVLSDLVAVEDGRGGWRLALPVAIELVVLNPHDPILAFDLLEHVHESRQVELLDAVVELFEANSLHPHATMLYSAGAKLLKGNPGGCLKTLATLAEARIARPDLANRLRSTAYFLSAQAMEKLGDYRKAYAAYRDMKAVPQGRPISLDEFPAMVTSSAKLDIPALPADAHTNHFIMTGFPRSGTTLLETRLRRTPGSRLSRRSRRDRARTSISTACCRRWDQAWIALSSLRRPASATTPRRSGGTTRRRRRFSSTRCRSARRKRRSCGSCFRTSATFFRSGIPATWC